MAIKPPRSAPPAPGYERVADWIRLHPWATAVLLFFVIAAFVSLCAGS